MKPEFDQSIAWVAVQGPKCQFRVWCVCSRTCFKYAKVDFAQNSQIPFGGASQAIKFIFHFVPECSQTRSKETGLIGAIMKALNSDHWRNSMSKVFNKGPNIQTISTCSLNGSLHPNLGLFIAWKQVQINFLCAVLLVFVERDMSKTSVFIPSS